MGHGWRSWGGVVSIALMEMAEWSRRKGSEEMYSCGHLEQSISARGGPGVKGIKYECSRLAQAEQGAPGGRSAPRGDQPEAGFRDSEGHVM